jgi:hypothetical protein
VSNERPESNSQKSNKFLFILLGGGALVAVLGLCCIGGVVAMFVMGRNAVNEANKPVADLDAREFTKDISGNPASASKYQGKVVRLRGKLKQVTGNIQGQTFMYFESDPLQISPRCFFSNPAVLQNLRPGDPVTLEGRLYVNGGLVDLMECKLVDGR